MRTSALLVVVLGFLVSSRTDLARQARIKDLPRRLPEYFASIGCRW
jgi:hypothetical protein